MPLTLFMQWQGPIEEDMRSRNAVQYLPQDHKRGRTSHLKSESLEHMKPIYECMSQFLICRHILERRWRALMVRKTRMVDMKCQCRAIDDGYTILLTVASITRCMSQATTVGSNLSCQTRDPHITFCRLLEDLVPPLSWQNESSDIRGTPAWSKRLVVFEMSGYKH